MELLPVVAGLPTLRDSGGGAGSRGASLVPTANLTFASDVVARLVASHNESAAKAVQVLSAATIHEYECFSHAECVSIVMLVVLAALISGVLAFVQVCASKPVSLLNESAETFGKKLVDADAKATDDASGKRQKKARARRLDDGGTTGPIAAERAAPIATDLLEEPLLSLTSPSPPVLGLALFPFVRGWEGAWLALAALCSAGIAASDVVRQVLFAFIIQVLTPPHSTSLHFTSLRFDSRRCSLRSITSLGAGR